MNEIEKLALVLEKFDSDGQFLVDYYTSTNPRYPWFAALINEVVIKNVPLLAANNQIHLENIITSKKNQLNNLINDRFWHHMYPAHETHFHRSFEQYINCPFTCFTEVKDCIEKISREAKGEN